MNNISIFSKIILIMLFFSLETLGQRSGNGGNAIQSNEVSPSEARQGMHYKLNPLIPDNIECEQGLGQGFDSLRYLGLDLRRGAPAMSIQACVRANNDQQAAGLCGVNRYNIINPGNPEYNGGDRSKGSITTNNLGYYYCIPENQSVIRAKSVICAEGQTRLRRATDRLRRTLEVASYVWNGAANNGNGECRCRNRANNIIPCPDINELEDIPIVVTTDELAIPTNVADLTRIEVNLPTITDPIAEVNSCIERWRTTANECKSGAESVEAQCASANERNADIDNASESLAAISNNSNSARAGQGVQASCFKMGAITMGAREVLGTTRERCEAGELYCRTSCQASQAANMVSDCVEASGRVDIEGLRSYDADIVTRLQEAQVEVEDKLRESEEICSVTVPRQRSDMDRLMTEFGNTLQSSTQCACQSSSTPGQNCNSIPNISTCEANPMAAGCQAYEPISVCAPGSASYNAQTCACVNNPTGPGCAQVNGGQGPPTFASTTQGLPLASSVVGSGGGAVVGGGGGRAGGGSFDDLSGAGGAEAGIGQANLASNLKPGEVAGSAGGGAGSGGGGGGGNGAASAPDGKPTAAVAPEKKDGLGGLFKDVKNAIANALGGGGGRNSRTPAQARGGLKENPNIDKYKPNVRGGTQGPRLGAANGKTLFQLVNECTNGVRCKSTVDSFMVEP